MEQQEETRGNARFGAYLKRVREDRRLSLDAVEELSAGFPEKVTKSHLSRIENGLALPTFPRLMAMSHIYGVPIASLAERYEIDLRRGMTPVDLSGKSEDEVLKEIESFRLAGNHHESLVRLLSLIDERYGDSSANAAKAQRLIDLRILVTNCLNSLGRHESAKSVCEQLLSRADLTHDQKLYTVLQFAISCHRLGRYTVAMMALDQVAAEINGEATPRKAAADFEALRGNVYLAAGMPMKALPHLERAKAAYEQLSDDLDSIRAGLVIADSLVELGRLDEAESSLRQLLASSEAKGFDRQKALAYGHLAIAAFKRGDITGAESFALKSNATARAIEHHALVFRNCFYLWEIAKQRGDASATKLNERTLRSYLGRIESRLPEAESFRTFVERGES